MDRAEVAVRRPQHADERLRVGTVLSREGTVATVQWNDDGTVEENVRLGVHTLLAIAGTLRHQSLIDRPAVVERFARDPMGMILKLLGEASKGLKAAHIKEQLVELGLEKEMVDKAWKSTYAKLAKRDDVQVKEKAYRWLRPTGTTTEAVAKGTSRASKSATISGNPESAGVETSAPNHVSAPAAKEQPRSGEEPSASHLQAQLVVRGEGGGDRQVVDQRAGEEDPGERAAESAPQELKSAASGPRRRKKSRITDAGGDKRRPGDVDSESAATAGRSQQVEPPAIAERSLREVLGEALGDASSRPGQGYLSTPLRVGARLGVLDDSVIDTLLSAAEGEERLVIEVLLLAVPRTIGTVDLQEILARLDPAVAGAVIDAAAAELRKEGTPDVRAAAVWLVRRASSAASLPNACMAAYIELIVRLLVEPQKTELDVLDTAAHVVARKLPDLLGDAAEVETVARIVRRLPFSGKGGRVALMAAVAQARPDIISDDKWWNGVTVQSLSECIRGPLSRVISLPDVTDRVIRPIVAAELSTATTRSRLSFFLGLPAGLAEHLAASDVADAFRRVSDQDPIAASWTDSLSGQGRVDALRKDLMSTREESATAVKLAEEAELRAQEVAERCTRLERDLQDVQTRAIRIRAAQERQLQIDVVRALADLAAEVEELANADTAPAVVIERVRGLVAAHSLRPIGDVKRESEFDPLLHDSIVGAPIPGSVVTVIRPGYTWAASGEEILLHKALVEPAEC
ncbi:hypothetical protein [Microtetraspora glauca]|uniref:Nucleotide exchange factor GrpE n=1 Tax=Microtetraspora glauca TaxID=1996 RepID=A0ABV3GTN6_MICGL